MKNRIVMIVILAAMFVLPQSIYAYSGSTLEITNGKASGDEMVVDVNIHETRSLHAGSFTIEAPSIANFELEKVELSPGFENGRFEASVNKSGNEAEISFIAKNSAGEYNVTHMQVATLTYSTDDAETGDRAVVEIGNPSLTDASGDEVLENHYEGTLTKQRPLGDVLGTDQMNVAQAARILQHANGFLPFSETVRPFGDVNNDGNIAHTDAQWILDMITGKRHNLLHIAGDDEVSGFVETPFSYEMEAEEGYEPYTWSARSLPYGLSIDKQTGVISGEPRREENKTATITVEDRTGNEVTKEFTFTITESDIQSVQKLEPVTVEQGETLEMPAEADVTYKDGTNKTLPIEWNDFDTNQIAGEYSIQGTVGEGYTVSTSVVIYTGEAPTLPEKSITSISDQYSGFLGFHSITAETTREVYRMEVEYTRAGERRSETQEMFYESDNVYSKNLTQLNRGAEITITAYSEFDEKLTEKTYRVQ